MKNTKKVVVIIVIFLFVISASQLVLLQINNNSRTQSVEDLGERKSTYFQLNLIDAQTEQFIGPDATVKVFGTYEGTVIENYTIFILLPNDNTVASWNPDHLPIGTVFSLTAIKDGYAESEPYVFTVTEDTPTQGLLFKHTFRLNRIAPPIEPNNFIEDVIIQDKKFNFAIVTSSNLVYFTFDENIESLILSIDEPKANGFLNITIPSSFMKENFIVIIDDIARSDFNVYAESDNYVLAIRYQGGMKIINILGEDVFKPTVALPILTISISDSTFNENEEVIISGVINPLQPSSDILLEFTTPLDETPLRTISLLGDGTFEYIFIPDQTGEWKAIAKYNFNEEIIESNIIGFSVISISEPRVPPEVPEPEEPEPKPEEPEPEQPLQPEKQIEVEEDQDLPDESDETRQVFDNYLFIVLILILAVIIFEAITKQDKLKPYFQKNRIPDKKP